MKYNSACPICYSSDLQIFNNRSRAKCGNCGSLERTRLLYLLLQRMGKLRPNLKILHFSPEPGLHRRLKSLSENYQPVDYEVSQYTKWEPKVEYIDMCDLSSLNEEKFDLIIHNHVLEHVPCSPSEVLSQLKKKINFGGSMLFSIPIRTLSITVEDERLDLSSKKRQELFGQSDHLRIFGENDVLAFLNSTPGNNVKPINPYDYLSLQEITEAGIPTPTPDITGSTIFQMKN